jgi:hypothetical protein
VPFQHHPVIVTDLIEYLVDRKNRTVTHKQVTAFLRRVGGESLGQRRLYRVAGAAPAL